MRFFLICLISFFQSLFGIMTIVDVVGYFQNGSLQMGLGFLLFSVAALFGMAWLNLRLRGHDEYSTAWLIAFETILSPIAMLRCLIALIALILSNSIYRIDMIYDSDITDQGFSPLEFVSAFVLYFTFGSGANVTRLSNFLTQTLLLLPLTGLLSLCGWGVISFFVTDGDIGTFLICAMGNTALSACVCAFRGQESSVSFYTGDYKFVNAITGAVRKIKAKNKNVDYYLTDEARDYGWETESNGYGSYYTGWMIATMIFSPILFYTQIIACILSLIAAPQIHIISCYTKLEYDDYAAPFFQRILHFFFNIVIC